MKRIMFACLSALLLFLVQAGAVSAASQATPGPTKKAKALMQQGITLFRDNRVDEALDAFSRAIAAYPELASAWEARAIAHVKIGDFAAARQDYDKAIALDPRNGRTYFNRALLNKKAHQEQAEIDDLMIAAGLGHEKAKLLLEKIAARAKPAEAGAANPAPGQAIAPTVDARLSH